MHLELPAILKCTYCSGEGLKLAEGASIVTAGGVETVISGKVKCPKCGSSYPVQDGIINFLPRRATNIGIGQWTNHNGLVAWGYERLWRKQALTLLGQRPWPIEEELATIVKMLILPEPQHLTTHNEIAFYLDQGCSNALYGRGIARALEKGELNLGKVAGHVVALDNSWPMLQEARGFIERDGLSGHLSLVRADTEQLPFIDEAFAGIANGGSLNEFRHTDRALAETRRTLAPHGRVAYMVQMKAKGAVGAAINDFIHLTSGLHFFTLDTLNQFYRNAELRLSEQQASGLITISQLFKSEETQYKGVL